MVSFVNSARIASIFVGFHLGIFILHGYFFHQDIWPNLDFPLECQIELVLKSSLEHDRKHVVQLLRRPGDQA